ncbi:MAG: sigma-70 family RNA polymerase sigma factor [Ktedonobacterales bacterium]|nr:sigma-70 family RNA polymerase sigma factor [Ktedonobacterales bacterium]
MSFTQEVSVPARATALTLATHLDAARPLAERMAAVDAVIRHTMADIVAYIRTNITDPQAREDVAQDTWTDFAQAIRDGQYHDWGIAPLHYLMAIARRRIRHYQTHDPAHCQHEIALPDDEGHNFVLAGDETTTTELKSDFDAYFDQMLNLLAEEDRVLAQLWRQGYTVPDIAAATGRQYRSAWNVVQRMLTLMRRVCPADFQ